MPYKSDKQRRFLHARHPKIAARWDDEIRDERAKRKVRKSESTPLVLQLRPTTKREQKAERIANTAGGAVLSGGLSGVTTNMMSGGKMKPTLIASGVGAGVGGALGASSKPAKSTLELAPKNGKRRTVNKSADGYSAFGVRHEVSKGASLGPAVTPATRITTLTTKRKGPKIRITTR